MNALRMLAIVAGLQAQLDVLREELEKDAGIERRPPPAGPRRGMPAMYGRASPDEGRERDAGLQRLHEAAAAAPGEGAAETSTTDTPQE